MIWINKNTTILEIPKHTSFIGERYGIKLKNVLTSNEYNFTAEMSASNSALLYKFQVGELPTMDVGEYEYELYAFNTIEGQEVRTKIESGLLNYGDYTRETSQYEPEANTIIQYNGE